MHLMPDTNPFLFLLVQEDRGHKGRNMTRKSGKAINDNLRGWKAMCTHFTMVPNTCPIVCGEIDSVPRGVFFLSWIADNHV